MSTYQSFSEIHRQQKRTGSREAHTTSYGTEKDDSESERNFEHVLPASRIAGSSSVKIVSLLSILASSVVIFFVLFGNGHDSRHERKISRLDSTEYTINIEVESPGYGSLSSTSLLPWDAIAEPAKNQTLYVSSFQIEGIDMDLEDFDVSWNINDEYYYSGSTVNMKIDEVGVYSGTVELSPITTGSARRKTLRTDIYMSKIYSYDFTLAVKYVRREIRSLSDDDRNKFLDALQIMYTVDGDTGREKYGSKYIDASEAVYKHLNGAGRTDCDHWHDGAGLIVHHMAYTLQVEQSLQTIDSSISMPYWEYGMDTYLYDSWMDSPIFDADWFGEANPTTADHSIGDGGRWDGLGMPSGEAYKDWDIKTEASLNPFLNGYGYMRGPWNNNPSTKLGRHNTTYGETFFDTMPDCDTLQSCFDSTSMAQVRTHTHTHISKRQDSVSVFFFFFSFLFLKLFLKKRD